MNKLLYLSFISLSNVFILESYFALCGVYMYQKNIVESPDTFNALIKALSILLILCIIGLTIYLKAKKKDSKHTVTSTDTNVRIDAVSLNRTRHRYLLCMFLLPLLLPCLFLLFMGREWYYILETTIECIMFFVSIGICINIFWLSDRFANRISDKYTALLINSIEAQYPERLSSLAYENIDGTTFQQLGMIKPMDDPYRKKNYVGDFLYDYTNGGAFSIRNENLEFSFLEFILATYREKEKSVFGSPFADRYTLGDISNLQDPNINFHSFCMKIPVKGSGGIRLSIEPKQLKDYSDLHEFTPSNARWSGFADKKCLVDNEDKADKFLSSSTILDNISMIDRILGKTLNDKYITYKLYEKTLYVFAHVDVDLFDISLYEHAVQNDIEYDYRIFECMCKIAKEYKS